jgi:hypothetical protein
MSSISHITIPPARHTLALGLITVTMTMILMVSPTTSIFLVPPLVQSAFADHGQEVVLSEKESSFVPKSSGEEGNQLKVVVNYAVSDPMTVNDLAKAVMKVYSPDGALVKTSSSPTSFRVTNSPGTVTLATTLTDTTIEGVIAKIVFTNPIKTEAISNELPVSVDLIKGATLSEPQEEKIPEDQSRSDSSQDVPTNSLSEEINEEASIIRGNQQETSIESTPQTTTDNPPIPETTTGYALEQAPITQADQQETSIESTPQTTIDNPPIRETTTGYAPPPVITREICDDGIDNDGDILIDLSDRDCSTTQHQYQLRPQQEQTMGQTPEVCEDSLDNDLDGKIDNRDEECTTSSFSPSIETQSSQAQPSVEKETGKEDKVKEQQPDEDVSEKSGEREGNDDDEDEDSDQQPDDEDSDDDDDNEEDE